MTQESMDFHTQLKSKMTSSVYTKKKDVRRTIKRKPLEDQTKEKEPEQSTTDQHEMKDDETTQNKKQKTTTEQDNEDTEEEEEEEEDEKTEEEKDESTEEKSDKYVALEKRVATLETIIQNMLDQRTRELEYRKRYLKREITNVKRINLLQS